MADDPVVPSFDQFWKWIKGHPNCIVSAGTIDAVIFDHDDFHWYFAEETNTDGQSERVVQAIRGKQLVGEIMIPPRRVTHVQGEARAEDEFVFECFEEGAPCSRSTSPCATATTPRRASRTPRAGSTGAPEDWPKKASHSRGSS